MKSWFLRFLLAIDQLANVIFLNGDEDETISSNAAKARREGKRWGCVLCSILDRLDRDHCEKSLEPDEGRAPVLPY